LWSLSAFLIGLSSSTSTRKGSPGLRKYILFNLFKFEFLVLRRYRYGGEFL
jgi:hypothetical protein